MPVVELFRALGDPTRLEMVQRLSSGASYTISTVSSGLDITRQGARKHLQILADAKVIKLEPRGRDVDVRLDMDTLEQGKVFIAELELRWDKRLEALRRFVDNVADDVTSDVVVDVVVDVVDNEQQDNPKHP